LKKQVRKKTTILVENRPSQPKWITRLSQYGWCWLIWVLEKILGSLSRDFMAARMCEEQYLLSWTTLAAT